MALRCGWVVVLAASIGCGDSDAGTASASNSGLSVSSSTGTSDATQGVPTTSDGSNTGTTSASTGSASGTSSGTGTTAGTATTDPSTSGGSSSGTTGAVSESGTTTGGSTSDVSSSSTGGPVGFCDGEGGILLPGDLNDMCTADLGKKTFLFAVCSCAGLTANNVLKTDSYDSEMMMNMMTKTGGSVGVNGAYSASSQNDIGGTLWVDGPIQTFNSHMVSQDVQCGGDYSATSPSNVGDDMYVEGNLLAVNKVVTIGGDLHIAAGKSTVGANVLGKIIKEPVLVKTPCDCNDPIDVAAIVAGYKLDNDNLANAIEPDQLIGNPLPEVLELPCGRFYFDAITPNNSLTIKLTGRTVLAIAGDVVIPGPFTLELGPDAELDLFVAGNVTLNNTATIGDTKRAAATRIYVQQSFKFSSNFVLGANLYQPNAMFTANNMAEIWGSLFVGGLTLASPFTVHYDQAILDLNGCEDPGGGCTDCHDCANPTPACKNGTCEQCMVDSDCCPPLVCDGGQCKVILPG